jgi:N-acetylglucosaminyl-diphospho-decaprenol L-rhamnosyltransferase
VVDNNSTDGSKDFFANRFPSVNFIWKNENAGFAKANNEAVKLAKGEKILFLNPDTILPEDCLEKCLAFFQQQKNIGALGIKMIDGAGNFLPESKRGFPSFFASFCKMTGLAALFPHSKVFAKYYLGHLPENQNNEVDILSGAFMMADKKVLDTVGSFDEDYFMYAEDIDLSCRIQKAACPATGGRYKNYYFAGSTIIHFKGESISKQNPEYTKHFYGTMVQFVQKHYSGFVKELYVLLLKFFISFKTIFIKDKKVSQPVRPSKIFVAGNTAVTEVILKKYFTQIIPIEKLQEAPPGSAVLLCEPAITFAEMIALMQRYKNQYLFHITASGNSIVASGNKNSLGNIYTI